MIYTYDRITKEHTFYRILEVNEDSVQVKQIFHTEAILCQGTTSDARELDWGKVGVYEYLHDQATDHCDRETISIDSIAGKAIIVGDFIMTVPMSVLCESL